MTRDLERALDVALELADAARATVLAHLADGFSVERKADGSPVTDVDRATERVLRDLVARRCPGDGVLGEEFADELGGADAALAHEWTWVFDPIDGTRALAAGIPTFTTLIGLLHGGRPVLGVIDQAVCAQRWWAAAGVPTRRNGEPVRARTSTSLAGSILGSTGPQFLPDDRRARFDRLVAEVRDVQWGGDAYLYAALASGGLDLVVEAGLALHDFAALVPVVEGAGGRCVDWSGAPLRAGSDGGVVACADPRLLGPVLELLRE
ncbi:Histidinol-phosphatase [Planctomycetes bacterium Pla163]|uniref:Histidinol-phosphatase n=1 Tax=Rohdeia mirabilis TaxID=2528008 RepID=A0A518CUP2_9BACT|nr:Histidinol-phosphatase [Planctomycetes bacterium Pla163]